MFEGVYFVVVVEVEDLVMVVVYCIVVVFFEMVVGMFDLVFVGDVVVDVV